MKEIFQLVKKDFQIDSRQKYPIAGIVLYIFATIYISYLAFQSLITPGTWNALIWIILLFASVTGISKSFIQEDNRSLYYFFLVKPHHVFTAKLLYSLLYEIVLILISVILFKVFLGFPVKNQGLFVLMLFIGGLGIACSFTLISSLAAKSENQSTMMAILGFPVVIPVLVLAVTNSRKIVLGADWGDVSGNTLTLLSVNVIIVSVAYILFPYSWRN